MTADPRPSDPALPGAHATPTDELLARRFIAVIQDERGYPPAGQLDPAPPEGPKPPMIVQVVKADDYETLEAERDRLNDALKSRCQLCDHEWSRHDPEDGQCDAHAEVGFGPCQCGRDLSWMRERIAAMSTRELERKDR